VYDQFKFFNSKILKPSIKSINQNTDLNITMVVDTLGRVVRTIKFEIEEVKRTSPVTEAAPLLSTKTEEESLVLRMKMLGIKVKEARQLVQDYSHDRDYLIGNIEVVETAVEMGKVTSPSGYLIKALKEDYRRITPSLAPKTSRQQELFEAQVEEMKATSAAEVEAAAKLAETAQAAFQSLSEAERSAVIAEFLERNAHARKSYHKDPESSLVKNILSAYLVQRWYPEQSFEVIQGESTTVKG